MARNPDAPSRMDILVLSSLARIPMHGYELKLELRYKHVRWWAKAEHGHLYASLARLERRKLIKEVKSGKQDARGRKVYAITAAGRRDLLQALRKLGSGPDQTFFDIDLFLSSTFVLPKEEALEILEARLVAVKAQAREAEALFGRMSPMVPLAGRLIMSHRIEHLNREVQFVEKAMAAIQAETRWGPMMGEERIRDFLERTGAEIERG